MHEPPLLVNQYPPQEEYDAQYYVHAMNNRCLCGCREYMHRHQVMIENHQRFLMHCWKRPRRVDPCRVNAWEEDLRRYLTADLPNRLLQVPLETNLPEETDEQ